MKATSFLILVLAIVAGVSAWCEKTHFSQTKTLNEIDISPDRTMILTSSSSKLMIVWNFSSLHPIFILSPGQTIASSKFSKNQALIAVGLNNNQFRILNGDTFATLQSLTSTITAIKQVDFSWDNTRLLVCGSNAFQIWWTASWTKEVTTPNPNQITSCKFQKNGNYFIGDSNGKNNVYTTGTNALLWTDNSQGSSNIISADFDMVNWTVISTNGGGNKILIYPSAKCGACGGTTQSAPVVKASGSSANCVAFSKDGSVYAVGTNSYIMIFQNSTNNLLFNFSSSSNIISGVFSYDSQYYISGASSGVARVFKRFCQDCPAGTYESSYNCPLCSNAMAGCLNCANASYCFACGDGYAVDTVNNNCTLCQNTMTGCVLCNTTAICTACSTLYYLVGNACTLCSAVMPNCITCSSSSVCIRCNSEFYVDSVTFKCLPCGANNCVSCVNTTYCLSCARGYYLNNSTYTCTRCISNCTSCLNATRCTQCVQSYYLNSSNLCTICPINCLSCTSAACIRCAIGYYASGTGCMPCTGGCYSCLNSSYCYGCVPGYYQNSGSCIACSGGCLTCTSPTICLSCNVNFYYLAASNTCNKCQNLLASCLQCTNTTCLRCQSGYYYDGSNCVKCGIGYGCQTCYNSTFCMSCLSGYQLNSSTGVCSLCGVGCSSCANSSFCINCLPKYYLVSGVCTICPASCPTCLNATYCISCLEGYYVNGSQLCAPCNTSMSNCASCSASGYCTSCDLGYYLSSANTSCTKCAWPCSLCNGTQCNQCSTGYYLSSGSCSICPLACSSCYSSSQCLSCVDGFYLTGTYSCSSCQGVSTGCSACNQSTCFSCLTNLGYYLNSGSCSLCNSIANCLLCQNSTLCTTCSSGYYISSGACQSCTTFTSNCQSCNVTTCLQCMDPYFLSGTTCVLCAEGCSACSNAATCKSCLTGYLLQTNVCTYCDILINGCQVCTSATVCSECAEGYILSGSTCVTCDSQMSGCQFCNGTSVCLTCMDQYYLSGSNTCTKCSSISGCSQCNSSSICLSCQSGFYQTGSTCSQCADVMCTVCTNATNCISCLSGYYANSSGNCRSCNTQYAGCVMCSSTACLQCQSGYYLDASNQCSRCLMNGCQVCNSQNSSSCVTCSSLYYLTTSNTCSSCSLSISGCISCLSATQCLKCMVGSYLAANLTCQSCFSLFKGCRECSITGCTACQGGYIMNVTTCATCVAFIPGCLYCTSTSVCLSCQSGYYQSGNTCIACNGIAGCLDCSGSAYCNLCSDSFYLSAADHLCYSCNSTLTGCIACSSSTTCKVCLGNYALSGGVCSALKTVSTQPYPELRLVTEYISSDQLKHRLIVSGIYNTSGETSINLTLSSTITMVGNSASTQLTILNYYWVGNFELVFITNNPLGSNFSTLFKKMPAARLLKEVASQIHSRLLPSNVDLNYDFKLDMTENAIQAILPSSDHMGSLSLSNPAENPSFIRSIYDQTTYNYHYFGLILMLLMLVIYFVKAAVSVPQSDDHGELMSHIFLLRCGGIIFSMAYVEYMDYCYGFLSPDFPWLNNLTASLAASADLSPNSYLLFYPNMTIASSYLCALLLVILIGIVIGLFYVAAPQYSQNLKSVGIFFYNFFQVGLIMAGSMSIQGAYYNNFNYFTSNTIFYMSGILLYIVLGAVNIWMTVRSIHRINKIRIMVKTTFLSLIYVSPIYLLPIALGVEAIFVFAEYHIKKAAKLHPHLWVTNQVLVNLGLAALVLLSNSLLSILIPSILVGGAVGLDLFIHIREFKHQQQLVKVREIQKLTSLMETQEKLNKNIKKRNNNIYETTKMNDTLVTSIFSQDIVFNGFDDDISSSNSPFHKKRKMTASSEEDYLFKQV